MEVLSESSFTVEVDVSKDRITLRTMTGMLDLKKGLAHSIVKAHQLNGASVN